MFLIIKRFNCIYVTVLWFYLYICFNSLKQTTSSHLLLDEVLPQKVLTIPVLGRFHHSAAGYFFHVFGPLGRSAPFTTFAWWLSPLQHILVITAIGSSRDTTSSFPLQRTDSPYDVGCLRWYLWNST